MQTLSTIWIFIQDQLLGMKWLSALIGQLLNAIGLDTSGKLGGSIQFFIYDVIKIVFLLCLLIFIISYIQSFFSARKNEEDTWKIPWNWCKYHSGITGNCYTILFLFVYSIIHWIYKCRVAIGCYIQLLDFFSNG